MNTSYSLLLDVLKLRVLYSDEDFDKVIEIIRVRDSVLSELLEMLKEIKMEDLQRKGKNSKNKNMNTSLSESLEIMRNDNPSRYKTISKIIKILKSISVKGLKQYISNAVPFQSKSIGTKQEIIDYYISQLMTLSDEELELEMESVQKNLIKSDSDLNTFLAMADKIIYPEGKKNNG